MAGIRARLFLALVTVTALVIALPAYGDEVAPELEGADLRAQARTELKKLVAAMPEPERQRLTGVYVAFDPSVSDPIAQVACDDDGDYVVLLSDAMLRLLAHVVRIASCDELTSRRIEDYAAFLARTQVPGKRLLPPGPGTFSADGCVEASEGLAEALAFVVASELARLRAGDLVCPSPTATRESGDDVWTAAEQRGAAEIAARIYPGRQADRDRAALEHLRAAGRIGNGYVAIGRFFAELDVHMVPGRFVPGYSRRHPDGGARLSGLRRGQ